MTRQRWYVNVWVRGEYCGQYEHDREEGARADASDRRERLAVLGCSYTVTMVEEVTFSEDDNEGDSKE